MTLDPTTYTITKQRTYSSQYRLDRDIRHLQQLERDKDTFTEVHIPEFSFSSEGLVLTIQSEFIKGHFVGHRFSDVLYRELVEREHPWTFTDYNIGNFIKQINTSDKIYCVDLESYKKMEISKRKEEWNRLRINRVMGDNGWCSQKTDCRFCRKTVQEMVDEYTFFGEDVF
tara:strand:+ start:237 stop:749 length:513 start_codon:yes stop_codon:yes gene_type:complete